MQKKLAANSDLTLKPKRGRGPGRPFKPGQSGNPSGRPKDVFGICKLAREHSADGILALVKMMEDETISPQAKIAAIAQILDRGLGKPMQHTTMQYLDENGLPAKPVYAVTVTRYDEHESAPAPKANGRSADASH